MIYGLMQRVVRLLAYRDEGSLLYGAHAGLKIAALALAWAALLAAEDPRGIAAALAYPLLLHILAPRWLARHAVAAAMIPTIFIAVAAVILSPYAPLSPEWGARVVILAARTYGLASATLLTFSTTSPARLASLLHRVPAIHDLVMLFYRVTPQTVSDLAEALAAQRLLGKKPHHTLPPLVLSSIRRAEGIAVSLQARGYSARGRTPVESPGSIGPGLLLAGVALAGLAALHLL